MSASAHILQYLLSADGLNQPGRSQPALDPAALPVDGRTLGDLAAFIHKLAAQVRYYDDQRFPQGDWQAFFDQISGASESELQAMLTGPGNLSPHLALLMAYFKAFSIVRADINQLTKKRLDYYYEEVLRLRRTSARPDKVHVLFEPSKFAKPLLLKAGTELDGGKAQNGKPLHYALDSDLVVTQAKISGLRNSYRDFNTNGKSILFRSMDASTVRIGTRTAWRPLGTRQLPIPEDSGRMETATIGWAAASPNLLLAEGLRTVKMTVRMKAPVITTAVIITPHLKVALSTEKGWMETDFAYNAILKPKGVQQLNADNEATLEVTVTIPVELPAITAYKEAVHKGAFRTQWPVMKVSLEPQSFLIEQLGAYTLIDVTLDVGAQGMKKLVLQNDQALQAADKPVSPFTSQPRIGSSFYVGSQEAFSKTLTSMKLTLEWQDPPADFSEYYEGYGNDNVQNGVFRADVHLLNNRNWDIRLLNKALLFVGNNPLAPAPITVIESTFTAQTAAQPYRRNPSLALGDGFTHDVNQGFVRLSLVTPTAAELDNMPAEEPFEAFGHKTYPVVYTKTVIAISKMTSGTPPPLPKTPYNPVLKSVAMDYTAKDTFLPDQPNGIDQFFLQDLFGPAEPVPHQSSGILPEHPGGGALYLGLEGAEAPQTVSLLLQIEEGSLESDTLLRSADLHWSYLSGSEWRAITGTDILEESTNGLQRPGIIRLNIGADASLEHSRMPSGMRWLRLHVDDNPGGAASVKEIFTQAATATLLLPETGSGGFENHLAAPLAAGSITKLVRKIPSLKKVTQPFASFDGQSQESDTSFYRRVSERLRHKNRAVSTEDFERMLLEYFPGIYKVKCIPHNTRDGWMEPGQVRMVVVPDWRKRPTGDPLQPKANLHQLREMGDFLTGAFTSPFVNLQIDNPTYETLLIDCQVSFNPGFDPGYYGQVLEEDLKRFLSPWAYDEGQDIVFGGKLHASEIQSFIEGREYVNYIVNFALYHRHDTEPGGGIGDMKIGTDFIVGITPEPVIASSEDNTIAGKAIGVDFVIGEPVDVASATRPDAILVSNGSHRIMALPDGAITCSGLQDGIGQMVIGLDFIIFS
ncbi:baseplate J/gp47 family protein [Chitinophaga rhizosphaerae]|uniref:baseplate J/gp47 family protein n=1 Tax=Chitinophaga rhizosphaerae TaxID=1864947 RepID=UPI000F80C064|nr:baseplate J/gp47 family protein [Chitinophaga rhizosphaerae]